MPTVQLTTSSAFSAPLEYHNNVALFLQQASLELPTRAAAILAEVRQKDAHHADQLSNMLHAFAKRLGDEGRSHADAVSFLQQQYAFLAQREATVAGAVGAAVAAEFPALPTLTELVPAWLEIIASPVHSCFDEFRNLLNTYEHDLYAADQTLRDFEHLLWQAINHPEQLDPHVDWSGNPFADAAGAVVNWGAEYTLDPAIQAVADFMRAHEGEIRDLIDTVRNGVEFVVLPPVDGQRFQDFIDYVAGLERAYEQHIRQPFGPTTQTFAENYTPPPDQRSYLDSLGSVRQQQAHTADAFSGLARQLNQMQGLNEQVTMAQVGVGTNAAICLVSFGALVAFPPDVEVTVPTIVWRGGTIASILAGLGELFAAIAGAFAAIGALLVGIPLWVWILATAAVASFTIVQIEVSNANAATIVTTPDGRQIRVRKLTDKEVHDRGLHRAKGGQYGATDVIYVELDGNGNPIWGEYWIGPKGGSDVTEFP